MPFPFIPFGAIVAILVLAVTFVLFSAAVHKIDRTITDVGGAVVGRHVSGLGQWSHERAGDLAADHASDHAADSLFETASPVPVGRARSGRR